MGINFELASKTMPLILVRVEISSKTKTKTVTAIIDTGATGCVITKELAKELKFDKIYAPKHEKRAHGISGEIKIEFVKVAEIHLDGMKLKNVRTGVMDMSMIHYQFGLAGVKITQRAEMILGFPFFKGRILTIDYKAKKISIELSNSVQPVRRARKSVQTIRVEVTAKSKKVNGKTS
jgi:predicted aspartyl protease